MREVVSKVKKVKDGFTTSKGQIIIVGGNEVGIKLAEGLIQSNQDIVIVEDDDTFRKQIEERVDVLALKGKGTDVSALKRAGIENSNLLVAVGDNDYENLLTGIYAKKLGLDNVVVQVKEEKNLDYKMQSKECGVSLVVNPFNRVVDRVKGLIRPGIELAIDGLLGKGVQISKFRISHQSSFAYSRIDKLSLPEDSLLVCILRKGRAILPRGRDKVYPGDIVFIISRRGFKGMIGSFINNSPDQKEKVVLVGGGEISYRVAKELSKSSIVTIIEEDKGRCEELAEELSNTLILEGRGIDVDLLKEEGVEKANAFIATTSSDESNILIAEVAKSLGVKNSIAVVNDISYTYLSDLLPVDNIISPSAIAVDTILDYFYQGQVEDNTLFDGQIKVFEVKNKIKKAKSIKGLNLPDNLTIVLIKRGSKSVIANGESRILSGDKLVIFSLLNKGEVKGYFE